MTDALSTATNSLSLEAQKRADKDSQRKAAKALAAIARDEEKRATSKVIIKRVERNKRKFVTSITGLEVHGLDLKKVAKDLGKRFAAGSSVTKAPGGGDEITLQGDLSDDVFDWIVENHKQIPEDNIECVEDKKKKLAP
jgi:density-regulated protein